MRRRGLGLYRPNDGADTIAAEWRLITKDMAMQNISAIRVLDAIKALAFIGDLSMGQPTDHSPRTGWLAARLAPAARLGHGRCGGGEGGALRRGAGCTANAAGFSDWLGDDIGSRAAMLAMRPDWAGSGESAEQMGAAIMP